MKKAGCEPAKEGVFQYEIKRNTQNYFRKY